MSIYYLNEDIVNRYFEEESFKLNYQLITLILEKHLKLLIMARIN